MKNLKKLFLVYSLALITFTGFKSDNKIKQEKQNYSKVILADALASPLPVCGIFYLDDVDLLGQYVPYKITPIYRDSNYYYSDSSFTTFVPDGYYSDPNTAYYIPYGYRLYFNIVNGWIIEHIYVYSDVEDPGTPWCP